MSLNTFLMLCNVWIFCSLIYRQIRLRRREAEIEERQFWATKMRLFGKDDYKWN